MPKLFTYDKINYIYFKGEAEKMSSKEENTEKKEDKNSKKIKNRRLWVIIIISAILIIGLIFSTAFALLNIGRTTIAKGVSIKGVDVSNLTI